MQINDLIKFIKLPKIQINLMFEKTAENEPFFAEAVQRFYRDATALHPKFLFTARKYEYGFAACLLPRDFETYFMKVDASARRNFKKAVRMGYTFRRIQYNDHLEDIRDIWMSTPVRQGVLPQEMIEGRVHPINDPPTKTMFQDYPYYGIFKGEKLVAYAASLISGELCSLNDLWGHATYLEDGIVPFLIMNLAKELITAYPIVKFFGYGTYFGASESMRRFKRKFLFMPHRVAWILQTEVSDMPTQKNIAFQTSTIAK
jgi:hypothetical protein